ncbi:unnamed protein product [Gongylonema pulchrum]|uniref:Arf-GAP domain-containing protein n=1 Tax=Gongylonema pulchrum TaxID=637853 RepID=A0A3P7MM22_9BILA|nr:unnamed protein product [Gongylonema pulchrum]
MDSWTPEQVQSMRVMGNKLARRVYEAELPEHFRRPQTDSALESFIRAKYEHKRLLAIALGCSSVRANVKKVDHLLDATEETRVVTGDTVAADPTVLAVGGGGDSLLLDLTTPVRETQSAFTHSDVGAGEGDVFEDFGPIVSAPPTNDRPEIFATDAEASSSSNVRNGITNSGSENNLDDLVAVLGARPPAAKKSTSDILALYETAPKFYARPVKQQQRQRTELLERKLIVPVQDIYL